jgi:hypothetical protein
MKDLDWVYSCVGPGWREILSDLIAELDSIGWTGEVHEVKEKFGGLRFYIGPQRGPRDHWVRICAALDEAESKSFHVCEDCGAPGELRVGGWLRTLCDTCQSARCET